MFTLLRIRGRFVLLRSPIIWEHDHEYEWTVRFQKNDGFIDEFDVRAGNRRWARRSAKRRADKYGMDGRIKSIKKDKGISPFSVISYMDITMSDGESAELRRELRLAADVFKKALQAAKRLVDAGHAEEAFYKANLVAGRLAEPSKSEKQQIKTQVKQNMKEHLKGEY